MFYLAVALYLLIFGLSARYWAPEGIRWWHVALTVLFLNGVLPETINVSISGVMRSTRGMCCADADVPANKTTTITATIGAGAVKVTSAPGKPAGS